MAKAIIWDNGQGGIAITVEQPHWNGNVQARLDKFKVSHPDAEIVELDNAEIPIQAGSFNQHGYPNVDKTLRDAWKRGEQGKKVGIDMVKGKEIAHERRRAKRSETFAPLDMEASIPAKYEEAESKRKVVRNKDAEVQNSIESASDPESLKQAIQAYQEWDLSQETITKTLVDPETFFDRFTVAEQEAIVEATKTDTQVRVWYDRLMMQKTVELDSPRLDSALSLLVSKGLITEQRKAEALVTEVI